MQDKYTKAKKIVPLSSPPKTYFSGDGVIIDNQNMRFLLTIRGYNGFGQEATKCYKFLYPNGYLNAIGTTLRSIGTYFPGYSYYGSIDDFLIVADKPKHRAVISICSPGLLQIEDSSGRITGYTTSGIRDEIPNILYDTNTNKNADILFPQEDYIIRVIGTEAGPYNLYEVKGASDDTLLEFHAQDIPVTIGEIHEYHINFDQNTKQITSELRIDRNVDGKYEKTINGGAVLVYTGNEKVTICHNASKNNPHEIEIAKPALSAHIAHGDIFGTCSGVSSDSIESQIKNKDKKINQENDY